jgi:predicted lipid-binding transport protein (Tim44 family)
MSVATLRKWPVFFGVFLLVFFLLQSDCLARAGRSGSIGSRGSRTYTSPSQSPSSNAYQSQPRSGYNQPYNQQTQTPAGGFLGNMMGGGGFFKSMVGGLAGGVLGSLLFKGLSFGGGHGGLGGGGFGLFQIILLGALAFGIYWFIKKRRQRATEPAYYQAAGVADSDYAPAYREPRYGGGIIDAPSLSSGVNPQSSLRQADPYFDEQAFKDMAMDIFFKIQGAWAERNPGIVRNALTDEIYNVLEKDAGQLRLENKLNKLDNIAVRSVDITEDWQESAWDYVTVRFYANLLDYTVDETTGQLVAGSKTQPIKFEEYWTFSRSRGSGDWRLSAITQPN